MGGEVLVGWGRISEREGGSVCACVSGSVRRRREREREGWNNLIKCPLRCVKLNLHQYIFKNLIILDFILCLS